MKSAHPTSKQSKALATDSELEGRRRERSISSLAVKAASIVGISTGILVALLARFAFSAPAIPLFFVSAIVSTVACLIAVSIVTSRRVKKGRELAKKIVQLGIAAEDSVATHGDELEMLLHELDQASRSVSERITRLRRIENYRQEFLGDVSHELQTPIFAVEGFAETLLEGALEDPSVNRSFVEKIHRNARRLSALVNDLSDISQIETGSLRMSRVSFDPAQLAQESVEALELAADQSGVQLFTFIGQGVGPVVGDRERVRQVVLNLLTNGIKYNNPGGSVELALWRSSEAEITFSVRDDGIGISAEDIPRVTERFFRVDKSRSRERGGTGLGLAIVKHIVEAHSTALQIQSRPGHGSTFSFALPVAGQSFPQQTVPPQET